MMPLHLLDSMLPLVLSLLLLCVHCSASSLSSVEQRVAADIHRAGSSPIWRALESKVQEQDLLPVSLSLKYTDDSQRAMELLFSLIANPQNAAPNGAASGLTDSLHEFHQRVIARNVLPSDSAAADFAVMSAFPALFPRYYEQLLSKSESDSLLTPPTDSSDAVESWMTGAGVQLEQCEVVSHNRDYYSCIIPKSTYMRLFPFAVLNWYEAPHAASKRTVKAFPDDLLEGFALHHLYSSSSSKISSSSYSAIHSALSYIGGANWWPTEANARGEGFGVKGLSSVLKHAQPLDGAKLLGAQEKPADTILHSPAVSAGPDPFSADDSFSIIISEDAGVQIILRMICPDRVSRVSYGSSMMYCYLSAGTVMARLSAVSVAWSWTEKVDDVLVKYQQWHNLTDSEYKLVQFSVTPDITYYAMRISSISLPRNYLSYTFTFQQMWTTNSGVVTTTLIGSRPISAQQGADIAFVKSMYRWASSVSSPSSYSAQAIGSFRLPQANSAGYYSPSDLRQFLSENNLDSGLANRVSMKGGKNDDSKPDAETQLDIQWLVGVSPGVSSVIYYSPVGDRSAFANVLNLINSEKDATLPNVVSFSYGIEEVGIGPSEYFGQTNLLLQQLASRGISILISSGDSGCWFYPNCDPKVCTFQCTPDWMGSSYPATSPYVTSVGATQLSTKVFNNENYTLASDSSYCPHEVACSVARGSLITTGGGFSKYFPRPAYQANAVKKYLSTCFKLPSSPTAQYFNASNRAFPDISVLGRAFTIVSGGQDTQVDGTSASSPALAAFISAINQQRKSVGLVSLGFLNDRIYQLAASNPEAFNDIVEGDNSCAGISKTYGITECCAIGFSTCVGFDSVTGVGSPRFDVLAPLLAGTAVPSSWNFSSAYAYCEGCGPAPPRVGDSDLSYGAKVGIAVACVIGGLAIVSGVCWYRRRKSSAMQGGRVTGYAQLEGHRGLPVNNRSAAEMAQPGYSEGYAPPSMR